MNVVNIGLNYFYFTSVCAAETAASPHWLATVIKFELNNFFHLRRRTDFSQVERNKSSFFYTSIEAF